MFKLYLKIARKIIFYYISYSFYSHDENWIKYLKVFNFNKKLRLGINQDGGYVIGDINTVYDLYISAGVGNEESFTRDFIEKYNLEINCYVSSFTTLLKYLIL